MKNLHWKLLLPVCLSGCVSAPPAPLELPVAVATCPVLPALPPAPPQASFVLRMQEFLDGRLEPTSGAKTPSGSLKKPGEPTSYALPTSGTEPRMKLPAAN